MKRWLSLQYLILSKLFEMMYYRIRRYVAWSQIALSLSNLAHVINFRLILLDFNVIEHCVDALKLFTHLRFIIWLVWSIYFELYRFECCSWSALRFWHLIQKLNIYAIKMPILLIRMLLSFQKQLFNFSFHIWANFFDRFHQKLLLMFQLNDHIYFELFKFEYNLL